MDKTNRGFDIHHFLDYYNNRYSLQKSSATEDAIWLGIDDANPQIMAKDCPAVSTDVGWVSYPIPAEVLLTTRMHLTRDQVKDLLPILQKFVDTGEL